MKYLIATAMLTLVACGRFQEEQPKTNNFVKTSSSEYFMTYKLNGKKVTLNHAWIEQRENDVRYTIKGSSDIQGDVNVVVIQHNDGPPRPETFTTSERNLVLIVEDGTGTISTLDMSTVSFGEGEFTIKELTDTYAKGTFNFIAVDSSKDTGKRNHIITDGRFKAVITPKLH